METDSPKEQTENKPPLVSVVIPLYNHEKYIGETVGSVLEQTMADFELIIVNDGSTDGSEKAVMQIPDDRIRYHFQENRGAHEAINKGLSLAKGRYAAILNSDDVFARDRLEKAVNVLESEEDICAVFSHLEIIDSDGKTIRVKKGAEDNWEEHDPETSYKGKNDVLLDLLGGNFLLTTSNLLCRKDVFDEVGYFTNLRYAHDYDFFLRLCHRFKVKILEEPLVKYRIHDYNTFTSSHIPEADFEVGLVLADFFLNHDLGEFLPNEDFEKSLIRFFNSVNTFNSDRMMLALVLLGMKRDGFPKEPADKNSFGKVCVEYFGSHYDVWKDSRNAWKKVAETNERLSQTMEKLDEKIEEAKENWLESQKAWAKWAETNKNFVETKRNLDETVEYLNKTLNETRTELDTTKNILAERENHIGVLLNSRSYKLGRKLTWPIRRLKRLFDSD